MTKTEVKSLGVEDLRALLNEHLEGITDDLTKGDLKTIVDENWDYLDKILNPVRLEEEDAEEETEEEAEAEDEEEISEVEYLLSKDLYTNKPNPRLLAGRSE